MNLEHGTEHLTAVVTACRRLEEGAHVVGWLISGRVNGAGDGLFVDVSRASSRWCAVADVLVQPRPPLTQPDADVAQCLLAGGALLAFAAVRPDRWLATCKTGQTVVFSARLPGRQLTLMAALYGWLVSGQPLASWPFGLTARPVPPSGLG